MFYLRKTISYVELIKQAVFKKEKKSLHRVLSRKQATETKRETWNDLCFLIIISF